MCKKAKKCFSCLTTDEAVLLYNKGIALYNVISRDYAFKYANKHYVSKNILRNNQHTFKRQIWKISYLTIQNDLIKLLEMSKKVNLTQSNNNVGIEGKYIKHIEGQKSIKNRVKNKVKQTKHFIHQMMYNLHKGD